MKKFYFLFLFSAITFMSQAQWNPNTSVNLAFSTSDVSDLQSLATSDGKTWIAFYTSSGGGYQMRAQLLDVNGFPLLGSNGVLVSNQNSGSATYVFNICIDDQNNLIIGHQYESGGSLIAALSKVNIDGTLPWVNDVVLGPGLAVYPAVDNNNDIFVAWINESPSTLVMQKVSNSGSILWPSNISVTVDATNTTRGQIVTHSNGDFTLLFQKRAGVINTFLYAQRYTTDGASIWAAPVLLSNLGTSGARYYSVFADGNTTYVGYYASGGFRFAAFLQKISSDGILPWGLDGSPISTYSTDPDPIQMTTSVAHYPNSPYVWAATTYSDINQNNYGVFVQKFDTLTGAVQLDPLGKEVYPISASRDQLCGKLSLYNDGPVFLNYDNDYKIYVTRLNSSGDFVWTNQRTEVSSTTYTLGNPKGRFAFTDIVNNQAVAMWTENRGVEDKGYAQNVLISSGLPIKLIEFKGLIKDKQSNLFWETSAEINNKGFEIEKSIDGKTFKKIAFVNSLANKNNSDTRLNYSFIDKEELFPNNYYRLKQIDLQGTYDYTKTILLRAEKEDIFLIKTIFPTPTIKNLNVSFQSSTQTKADIIVLDNKGKIVKKSSINSLVGENNISIDVSSFSKGIYYLKIISNNGQIAEQKWIKQ